MDYLLKLKARLEGRIEAAEAAVKRHTDAGPGYGNPMWAEHYTDRVAELKQKLYEVNLELAK